MSWGPKTILWALTLFVCLIQAEKVMIPSQISSNAAHSTYRLMVMQQNMLFISEQNRKKQYNVTVAPHPQMIYLNLEQYRAIYLQGKLSQNKLVVTSGLTARHNNLNMEVKTTYDFDLSVFDKVVYNQMSCGNCYAFSTVQTINLNNKIWHPSVPRLSTQHLTDCSSANMGCNGGYLGESMEYVRSKGLEPETTYPLNTQALQSGITPSCQEHSWAARYKISRYYRVNNQNSSNSLCMNRINVLYNLYSMSTVMHAGFSAFQFYKEGTFIGCFFSV